MEDAQEDAVRDDQVPASYILGGTWPDEVQLRPDAPLSAYVGLEIARRLKAAMVRGRLSQRALAQASTVAQASIGRILRGDVLCDVGTLARLEATLDTDLYPSGLHRRSAAAGDDPVEDR